MAVKNLLVRGGADFSGMQREMAKAQKSLSNFQSSIGSTMKKIGGLLGGLAVGKLIKDSTNMAMGVESAIGNINRNMGNSAKAFQNWVNTQAKGFGIAKADAYKYGSTFSNLLASFMGNTNKTAAKTEELMKATSIIAASTGRSYEDVAERIRSGMLGSTEAIEDLGVYTNISMIESTNAFKQFAAGQHWKDLDFQTQQQIRLAAILEQTYARYGNSLVNNTQMAHMQFIASLKNIQFALGQAFLPIYSFVLPALTSLANGIAKVFNFIAQFTTALFGKAGSIKKQTGAVAQQANSVGNLGNSMGDATGAADKLGKSQEKAGKKAKKAAKDAKGALMGFDEINQLDLDKGKDTGENSGKSGSGTGGMDGAGMSVPALDTGGFADSTVEVGEKAKAMATKVKQVFADLANFLAKHKAAIISTLGGIAGGFLVLLPTILKAKKIAEYFGVSFQGVMAAIISPAIITATIITTVLVGAFLYLYQTNEDFRNSINEIWSGIAKTFQDFYNNTLVPIGDYFVNGFIMPIVEAFNYLMPVFADLFIGISQILGDIFDLIFSTIDNLWGIIQPGLELLKTIIIDTLEIIKQLWDKYGQTLIKNIREFIKGVEETFQLIWDNIINPIVKPALEMLSWLWNNHLKALVKQVGEFIMKLVNGALEIWNKFIKPVIDMLVKDLGPTFSNVFNLITDVFGSAVACIADIAKGIFRILGGIIDFIVGVFTGNWRKAWQGVKDIFGGVWDSLVGLAKVPLNYIIDAINFVIRGLNKISFKTPDWVPGVGGKSFGVNISQIPKLAKGGITNGPTMALIGDNPGGKEVVSPLDKLQDIIASSVGTAVMGAMQFSNNNSNGGIGDVYLQVDGTTFARLINPYAAKESERLGNNVILKTT